LICDATQKVENAMSFLIRRIVFAAAALAVAPIHSGAAADYPERPITVIVPYAAGGAGDSIIRLLSPVMERSLGQPLVIDNRTGGGGTIGAQAVAKAAPDGHTLLLGATNNFAINQFLLPKVNFDPLAAFALITKVADVPSVLFTNVSVPAKTLGEFITHARADPGKLSYASPSVGTTPHLAVERLKQLTGIELGV
jgi:tripartite-type tricarboxylate transporter receptor subunit TctC